MKLFCQILIVCLAILTPYSSVAKTVDEYNTLLQSVNKHIELNANIPFSEQVKTANTKYIIKHIFVLDKDVTLPDNCILEFDGGAILGSHTLTFKNTLINSQVRNIITANCTGQICNENIYPEWFCNTEDYTTAITTAISVAKDSGASIIFTGDKYLIQGGKINFKSNLRFYSPCRSRIYTKCDNNYKAMFFCGKNAPDNVTFDNILFDQSLQEHKTTVRGIVNMHCILSYTSTNLTITNCKFISVGTNCIHVNGDNTKHTRITNNEIVFIRLKNTPDYDNSSMYILDDYHEIINNYVHGERQHGGIETHGAKGCVTNNCIENCNVAINICAAFENANSNRIISANRVSDCDAFCAFWQYDYLPPIRNVMICNNSAKNIKQAVTSVITNEDSGADMYNISICNNVFEGEYCEFKETKGHQQFSAIYIAAVGAIYNMNICNNIFNNFPLHIFTSNVWNSAKMKRKFINFENNVCYNCYNSKTSCEFRMYYSLFFIGGLIDINIRSNRFDYNKSDRNTGLHVFTVVSTGTGSNYETRRITYLNNSVPDYNATLYYSDNKNNFIVEDIDQLFKRNEITSNRYSGSNIPRHLRTNDVVIKNNLNYKAISNGSYESQILINPRITVTTPYYCYITAENINDVKSGDILYCETNGKKGLPNAFSGYVSFVSDKRIYMYSTSLDKTIHEAFLKSCSTLQTSFTEEAKSYGRFEEKPDSAEVGFRYFCIDRSSPEGNTNGIDIIWNGTDWVDVLGRIVK